VEAVSDQYTAIVERDQPFWKVTVPEIDRVTQARHLREVDAMTRELISLMEDIPEDSFGLTVQILLPPGVRAHLDRAEELRRQAAEANHSAAEESREAVRQLRELGLTVRDVGDAIGVSHQRAHQLVTS
jgi:hypothetical protein